MTNEQIDEAATILIDLLKAGSAFWPGLGAAIPVLTMFIRYQAFKIKAGLADGTLIPDGQGGIVTKSWADDPRHALNPDGSFRY